MNLLTMSLLATVHVKNRKHTYNKITDLENFRWCRCVSSLTGLRTLDPPLSPPSAPAEIFRYDDIMTAWEVGLRIVYVLVVT